MKVISILFICFLFLKSIVYSLSELNDVQNRIGGITLLISTIFIFIFSIFSILVF